MSSFRGFRHIETTGRVIFVVNKGQVRDNKFSCFVLCREVKCPLIEVPNIHIETL